MFELPTVDYQTDDQQVGPEGLTLRQYTPDDLEFVARTWNREYEFDGIPEYSSVEEIGAWYGHPNEKFDPARDVTIAEIDGVPVALAERSWVDTNDQQFREYRVDGAVLPEWRRKGIGTTLLRENIRLSTALARSHQTDLQRVLGSFTSDRQPASQALLSNHGFEQVRWFFEMTRDLSDPIPDVALPDGIEIRPVSEDQIRQIWKADVEAFRDHWGGFDDSDEGLRRFLDRPSLDTSLWVVAWEGDEVVAASINAIHVDENEALGVNRGWLHSIFTRRPWRKRGLANAVIARSLVLLKERGLDQGILGVDADNPTGALGIYERNGFVVAERSTAYRRALEL
jgi:ribosomal protein S18 acetylase RimI-like enzyme